MWSWPCPRHAGVWGEKLCSYATGGAGESSRIRPGRFTLGERDLDTHRRVNRKYPGLKCSCVRACELMLLLSSCAVLINRRQRLLSEFRTSMREVQSVSWSCPRHCTLCSDLHTVPRTNYRFCRLYIYILSFSTFWRPHSGIRVTVVWDVTPCRLAHVYQLPLLYGVMGSKFMRNIRWYHSAWRHVFDYRILVHLLQPHTAPCSALLLYIGEKMWLELGTAYAQFLQPNAGLAV